MSRKPAQLEMVGGKSPRQRMWEAIRSLGVGDQTFTIIDLSRLSKVEIDTVTDYVTALRMGGFVGRHEAPRRGESHRYWMARDNGLEAPRLRRDGTEVTAGRGNEAMWQAMRNFLPEFDNRELAAYASTTIAPVLPDTARLYIQALAAAGYLECTAPQLRGCKARPARYRLKPPKNTGPRPPMVQRTSTVYDPNLGEVVWREPHDWEDGHD